MHALTTGFDAWAQTEEIVDAISEGGADLTQPDEDLQA